MRAGKCVFSPEEPRVNGAVICPVCSEKRGGGEGSPEGGSERRREVRVGPGAVCVILLLYTCGRRDGAERPGQTCWGIRIPQGTC